MILEFKKHSYVDVDAITLMYENMVVVNGWAMGVLKEEYEIIEKAFRWQHSTSIYDKDMKKGGR